MGNSQAVNLVKDIKILDEQIVPHSNQSVTVIIGESDGNRTLELQVKRPLHFEKMVTFLTNDIAYAPKLSIKPSNSLRNLLINIKNGWLNAYSDLSSPVKYQTPVFDIRCIEPNNIVHLMMHAIPFCLQPDISSPIIIGNNVWIGRGCIVLHGSVIEDDVIVAANSVVKGHLIKGYIYGGSPAKILKKRNN